MTTLYINPSYTGPITANDDVVTSWGSMAYSDMNVKSLSVAGGSVLTVGTLTTTSLTVDNGSTLSVSSVSGVIDTLHIGGGAHVTISSSVEIKHLIIDNGAHVTFAGGVTVDDTFNVTGGSRMTVDGPFSVIGKDITVYGDVSYIWDTDVKSGSHIIHDQGSDPCYLAGSMVLMSDESTKAVEDLQIGDVVWTVAGPSAVTFVGSGHHSVLGRGASLSIHPDEAGVPVRIAARTFSGVSPDKDLLITPEHMIAIGERLVPARLAVNGSTIRYDYDIESYDYYHFAVEGGHALVVVNGFITETLFVGKDHASAADRWNAVARPGDAATAPGDDRNAVLARPIETDPVVIRKILASLNVEAPKPYDGIIQNDTQVLTLAGSGKLAYPMTVSDNGLVHTFSIHPSLRGTRVLLNCASVRADTIPGNGDDRRFLGFRGRIKFVHADRVDEVSTASATLTGFYPDGWSTSFPALDIPEGCITMIVQMDEYLPQTAAIKALRSEAA